MANILNGKSSSAVMPKQRLDLLLVERGVAPTRSMAQAMIMAGEVSYDTTKLIKPGQLVDSNMELTVADRPRYVSRGGDKLASVALELGLSFEDATVLDVGSSTGGFTDYALQHGASKVFAVDVGTAQLAYVLRQDPRVVVMERKDIRHVQPGQLVPQPRLAVIDVSFISLTKILEHVASLLAPESEVIAMAKPQFEADKPTADRYQGVIKDETVREAILSKLEQYIQQSFVVNGAADSVVAGAQGNRERFYRLKLKATR